MFVIILSTCTESWANHSLKQLNILGLTNCIGFQKRHAFNQFKICLLTYKSLHVLVPQYIVDFFEHLWQAYHADQLYEQPCNQNFIWRKIIFCCWTNLSWNWLLQTEKRFICKWLQTTSQDILFCFSFQIFSIPVNIYREPNRLSSDCQILFHY